MKDHGTYNAIVVSLDCGLVLMLQENSLMVGRFVNPY